MLQQLWIALTDRDWKTWVGHFVSGFLIAGFYSLVLTAPLTPAQASVLAVFTAFLYREADNWLEHERRKTEAFRVGVYIPQDAVFLGDGPKVIDGFLDLWTAVAGAILAAALI